MIRKSSSATKRFVSVGLLAQFLTLGGMMLPILLGLSEEVVSLVLVSGAATLLVHPATLGTYSIYASYRSPKVALTAMAASLMCLAVTVLILTVVGVASLSLGSIHWGTILTLIALNVLGQGCYFLVLSHLTMVGSLSALMRARLIYAIANSVAMLAASTAFVNNYSLALAAAVGYLISTAASLIWMGRSIPWARLIKIPIRNLFGYMSRSRHVVASFLLAGFSGQSAALSLVLLGPLAAPWAVATRISNGFQTLTMQVVAPPYDIELARAIRVGEPVAVKKVYRKGVAVGSAFGLIGSSTAAGFIIFNGSLNAFPVAETAVVISAIALFWGSQIASSVIAKYLTYAGKSTVRFWWELSRCLAIFLPMLFFSGAPLLAILSGVMCIFMILFLLLGWRYTRVRTRGRRRKTGTVLAA